MTLTPRSMENMTLEKIPAKAATCTENGKQRLLVLCCL